MGSLGLKVEGLRGLICGSNEGECGGNKADNEELLS